jgi:uncharacterized protein GlcG (DUF336 family)
MKNFFNKKCISAELAQNMINAAMKKAIEINKPMVIAILDESGNLKAFQRMDGAALVSIEVAQSKAYTALANARGLSTQEMFEYIKQNPALLVSMPLITRYTMISGGFPIQIDNEIIGGIGVSGGSADEDVLVAMTALEVVDNH